MKITPTLNFGGDCRDAIQMYEKAFGGKISCLITGVRSQWGRGVSGESVGTVLGDSFGTKVSQ